MKKKNLIILIFIVFISLLFFVFHKNENYSNNKIIEISYSYGGGFGTRIDTSRKNITFTNDGKVVLSNDYNSYTEDFIISKSKYMELSNYIYKRISLFNEKPYEDMEALDGESYSIKIKFDNGQTKEIGGYMLMNHKFIEIKEKIFKIIDSNILYQYKKNVELYQYN